MPDHPVISIVDADRDLADLLDDSELERARHEALTRVQRLSSGEWDPGCGAGAGGSSSRVPDHRRTAELPHRRRVGPPLRGARRPRRRHAAVAVGRRGVACPRGGRMDGARAEPAGGPRQRPRGPHGPLAAARSGAVQPRDEAGAPSRRRARDRAPPACRRPPATDPLAPRGALGPRPQRRHRRPAAARPSTPCRPHRRPAPVRHDRHGLARACRSDQPARAGTLGAARRSAARVAPPQARGGADRTSRPPRWRRSPRRPGPRRPRGRRRPACCPARC